MGARATAALNQMLTNFATGYAQDKQNAVADFLAPQVGVPAGLGRFKQFSDKNAFQLYNTERGLGGSAQRIQFEATDGSFDCRPQALEIGIDDKEYDDAGEDSRASLDQSRIKVLVSSSMLGRENKVVTLAKTIAAVGGVGVWSNAANDPVAEIDAQIAAIAQLTGMMPNRILFSLGAWLGFRNNAKTIARLPAIVTGNVNLQQASGMFLNPAMEIKIGTLGLDAAKMGATKNVANLIGSEVFVFIAQDNPSEYDPSFMKTFRTKYGGVDAVRTYRDENARSTIHALDWSEDVKITGTAAVKRVSVS